MSAARRAPAPRSRGPSFFSLLVLWAVAFVFFFVLFMPETLRIPVIGADRGDWNPGSFWFEPWGESGVHKGIDIFARRRTAVIAASPGLVVYEGSVRLGGNVVVILGPRWRLHYYAHLELTTVIAGDVVHAGDRIGAVGTSGNAAGKSPHLHYAIATLLPYVSRYSSTATQGWKKMFYLDPDEELRRHGVDGS